MLEYLLGTMWRNRKQSKARNWPIVFGQITETTVFSGKHEITLTVSYAYPVTDEPCPIPAEFEKEFYDADEAQLWADALADQIVPVRVNTENSWKSMLLDSDLAVIVRAYVASHCPFAEPTP